MREVWRTDFNIVKKLVGDPRMTPRTVKTPDTPTPPVTVMHIPKRYGSRGYGAKIDGKELIITHNPATVEAFAGVPYRVTTMLRSRWNDLPVER